MATEKLDPVTGRMTTGHEWNGIEELNTPVPRVVLFFLAATTLFAIGYWLLMPAWPLGWTYTNGLLGIDQRVVVTRQVEQAAAERAEAWTEKLVEASYSEALGDEALHVGVVDRARHHLGAAEVVDARIAGVHVVALARRADDEGRDRAVRLLFGGDRRQLDHQVRFQHQLLECLGGVVLGRGEALEDLLRGEDHLVGRLAAAALAAHAVGHHAQRAAGYPVVRQQFDLVLLVGAIAAMQPGRRSNAKRLVWCIHRREYKLAPHDADPANR